VDVPPGTSGGDITIAQTTIDQSPPSGYSFFGQQVNITAPAATPDNPLRLMFTLDSSLAPGQTPASIDLFRTEGGVTQGPIPGCTGPGAVPDPCVASRAYVNVTDIQITVLTSQASAWNVGVVITPTTTSTTSTTTTSTTTTTTTIPFCQGRPNGTACNDGNPCTGPDKCKSGVCQGKVLRNGTACDDGNGCTANDSCQSGVCVGTCQVGTVCGGGCNAKHCGMKGSVCSCR